MLLAGILHGREAVLLYGFTLYFSLASMSGGNKINRQSLHIVVFTYRIALKLAS